MYVFIDLKVLHFWNAIYNVKSVKSSNRWCCCSKVMCEWASTSHFSCPWFLHPRCIPSSFPSHFYQRDGLGCNKGRTEAREDWQIKEMINTLGLSHSMEEAWQRCRTPKSDLNGDIFSHLYYILYLVFLLFSSSHLSFSSFLLSSALQLVCSGSSICLLKMR